MSQRDPRGVPEFRGDGKVYYKTWYRCIEPARPYGTNFAESPGLRDMIETALEERLERRARPDNVLPFRRRKP
jgi:hypothetical protein